MMHYVNQAVQGYYPYAALSIVEPPDVMQCVHESLTVASAVICTFYPYFEI